MTQADADTDATPARSRFRHLERLRVRWAEVDMQQIVFNGHYLMYFDTAVAGWWRAMAVPYQATMAALAGDLYVRKATLEYRGSARYDDLCEAGVRCVRLGNSSMTLQAALLRDARALVTAELVYVFADPATQTSRPLPQALRDLVEVFEAGQPMVQVGLLPWAEAGARVQALRAAAAGEPGDPGDPGGEAADATALHALAVNRLGQDLGCARLLPARQGVAALQRVATLPTLRGAGVGRALVQALASAAARRGDAALQAEVPDELQAAAGFLQRCGFSAAPTAGGPAQAAPGAQAAAPAVSPAPGAQPAGLVMRRVLAGGA